MNASARTILGAPGRAAPLTGGVWPPTWHNTEVRVTFENSLQWALEACNLQSSYASTHFTSSVLSIEGPKWSSGRCSFDACHCAQSTPETTSRVRRCKITSSVQYFAHLTSPKATWSIFDIVNAPECEKTTENNVSRTPTKASLVLGGDHSPQYKPCFGKILILNDLMLHSIVDVDLL